MGYARQPIKCAIGILLFLRRSRIRSPQRSPEIQIHLAPNPACNAPHVVRQVEKMLIRRSDVLQERYRDQPDMTADARSRHGLSGDEIGHPCGVEGNGHPFSLRSSLGWRQWKASKWTKDTRIVTVRQDASKSSNDVRCIARPAQAIKSRMLYQLSYGLHGCFVRVSAGSGQPPMRTNRPRAERLGLSVSQKLSQRFTLCSPLLRVAGDLRHGLGFFHCLAHVIDVCPQVSGCGRDVGMA